MTDLHRSKRQKVGRLTEFGSYSSGAPADLDDGYHKNPAASTNHIPQDSNLFNTPASSSAQAPLIAAASYTDGHGELPQSQLLSRSMEPHHEAPAGQAKLYQLHDHSDIRYSLEPWSTSGASCDVFVGYHPTVGKLALKRPRIAGNKTSESQIKSFLSEADVWANLRHEHILRFVGIISPDHHRIWLVSVFAEQGSLPDYISSHPDADRFPFISQFTAGLQYLHSQKVVHGDLKGPNLLVSKDTTVLISDFGLSKHVGSGMMTDTSKKGAGSTPWMAPELLSEDDAVKTYASDVYGFGMTISEILRGETPFAGVKPPVRVMQATMSGQRPSEPEWVSPLRKSYAAWWKVAERCWGADPDERPTMLDICELQLIDSGAEALTGPMPFTIAESPSGTFTTGGDMEATPQSAGSAYAAALSLLDLSRDARNGRLGHVTGNGLRQPGIRRIANHDGQNTLTQRSNASRDRMVANSPMVTRMETGYSRSQRPEDEVLINGINRAHARYNDSSTKPSRPCHRGTRKTLLQTIREWIDDDSPTNPFFWLCGEVGVGKTTVAYTIAKEQDELHQLGASFFFNRDNEQRRHPTLFPSTLAYQIARFDRCAYQQVAGALRPDPDVVHRGLAERFEKLVVQPLVCVGKSSTRKVVIVIDGLDECSDPTSLLDILPLLAHRTGLHLRVLVTSRPQAAIVTKFENARLCHLTNQKQFHDIDSQTLDNDVRVYLEWTLGDIASEFHMPSPWPSLEQINALVKGAGGLFVIASMFDRYIRNPVEGNPSRQLQRILSRRKPVGRSPTAELDSMYDLVLDDAKQSLAKDEVDLALNLLQLTFLSSEGSGYEDTLSDMTGCLECSYDDAVSILRHMTSVLRIEGNDDDGSYVIPFHASFGEYIQDPQRCSVTKLLIEPSPSHAELATKFIHTFIRATEDGITGLEFRRTEDIPPKLRIPARDLSHHLSLTTDPAPIPLRQEKELFCQYAVWAWVSLWNLCGPDGDVVVEMKNAGIATACGVDGGWRSLFRGCFEHILDSATCPPIRFSSCLPIGRDETRYQGNPVVKEPDLPAEVYNIQYEWDEDESWFGLYQFADTLWRLSKIEHPNILRAERFDLGPFLELPDQSSICATIYVPTASCYSTLVHDWYPSLRSAFEQNMPIAAETVLAIAHALQYLLEHHRYYGRELGDLRIENIVLSKARIPMIHLPSVLYSDQIDPSTIDARRQYLAERGFTRWNGLRPTNLRLTWESPVYWRLGCIIYEMMTGEPPLKRYHDLVMEGKLVDDEARDDHTPLKDYRDLMSRVEMSDRKDPHAPKEQDYWDTLSTKLLDSPASEREDVCRHRYQTAIRHLLNDLQVSEAFKNVLRACWEADVRERIQEIITRLTAILEALRNQTPEATP